MVMAGAGGGLTRVNETDWKAEAERLRAALSEALDHLHAWGDSALYNPQKCACRYCAAVTVIGDALKPQPVSRSQQRRIAVQRKAKGKA